jgi:hypothetical protein
VSKQEYPWQGAYRAVQQTLEEEAKTIEKTVANPDSSCPARELRRERAATLRWVLGLMDTLERWEW